MCFAALEDQKVHFFLSKHVSRQSGGQVHITEGWSAVGMEGGWGPTAQRSVGEDTVKTSEQMHMSNYKSL